MKLVAYLRVSAASQREGMGLDVQRSAITAWARAKGHRVVAWHEDAISGTTDGVSRVGWAQVELALRTKTAQGVVVARVDRLSRDLIAQERMIEAVHARRAGIFSTRDSETENLVHDPNDPTRKLIRQVMGPSPPTTGR